MSYIFRLSIFILVASSIVFTGCVSKNTHDDHWKEVYKNARTNHDYITACVALNQLIISEKDSLAPYYDSLSFYYIKKLKNFDAGEKMVDKGLILNPNNVMLLDFKVLLLGSIDKTDEAIQILDKLIKLDPKMKHIYYKASLKFSKSQNIEEYFNTIHTLLYAPNQKIELIEVNVDQNYTQDIDIRSSMYMDKAKVAVQNKNYQLTLKFVDSALMLSPDYQEALAYRKELTTPTR